MYFKITPHGYFTGKFPKLLLPTTLGFFYRSRHYSLSSQIAVLNSILENFQGGLQVYFKITPHGYFTGKFPKLLLPIFLRTNFIKTTRLKIVIK